MTSPPQPDTNTRVAEFLAALVANRTLAGAAVVLSRRSGELCAAQAGMADLEAARAMLPNTIVRIHSMSKALTSVGLLMLIDEGACTLDTAVGEVLPAFAASRLTLRHLLTHTSGLAYPNRAGTPAERSVARALGDAGEGDSVLLGEWATRLALAELAHEPGRGFTYGVSTDLIGRVIEVLTRQPLDRALHERLFEPLGMRDTAFGVPPDKVSRVAKIYRQRWWRLRPLALSSRQPVMLSGGGGLFSTALDYARFCRMLLADGVLDGHRVLQAETVRTLTQCQLTGLLSTQQIALGHGLGAGVGHGFAGRVVTEPSSSGYGSRGTFGWDGMAGCTFFVDRQAELAGVFVTQVLPWRPMLHASFRRAAYDTAAHILP